MSIFDLDWNENIKTNGFRIYMYFGFIKLWIAWLGPNNINNDSGRWPCMCVQWLTRLCVYGWVCALTYVPNRMRCLYMGINTRVVDDLLRSNGMCGVYVHTHKQAFDTVNEHNKAILRSNASITRFVLKLCDIGYFIVLNYFLLGNFVYRNKIYVKCVLIWYRSLL